MKDAQEKRVSPTKIVLPLCQAIAKLTHATMKQITVNTPQHPGFAL
jgi:uncharacterized protein YwbE